MLFNSFLFFAFFAIVTLIYFLLPYNKRWILLLASSCYFYMVFVPVYILILGFTIVIDYFAGILIENAEGKRRKLFLLFSLIANIGVLAIFKYYNFLNTNLSVILNGVGFHNPIPYLSILLPIGLSFHTFQAMSYTIEVYRGNQKAERHFGIYSLYVMFFPQLVAGPIERPQNLLHQFREKHDFDSQRIISGLKLIIWGLFKKVVIADRLAVYSDGVFNHPHIYSGQTLIMGTLFFSIQIYCDFSGYSDMAIGIAKVLGFKLMQNFRLPYLAYSISDFWRRWHISLSTWFSDYLYIPLGGNRVSVSRWIFNIYVVYLVSGLWHGANWTYILWGGLHATYYLSEFLGKKLFEFTGISHIIKKTWYKVFKMGVVFSMVSFAYIFFRAKSIEDAFYITGHLFDWSGHLWWGTSTVTSLISLFLILLLVIVQILQYKGKLALYFSPAKVSRPVSWLAYASMLLAISILGMSSNAFIYFQF